MQSLGPSGWSSASRSTSGRLFPFAPQVDRLRDWRDGAGNGDSEAEERNQLYENGTRRRAPTACDMCRRRKTKCEFEGPTNVCLQCRQRKSRCGFNLRKPKIESLKRAQHVRTLETRLKQVESLLRTAGVLPEDIANEEVSRGEEEAPDCENDSHDDDDDPMNDDDYTYDQSSERTTPRTSVSSLSESNRDGDSPADHLLLLKTCTEGEPRYIGHASSLSILSREGIRWIRDKSGETDFPESILSQPCWKSTPWGYWRPEVFHDLFSCRVFKALPPRSEVFALLKTYFQTTNRLFPLYHEESFMRMVEWQYTQQTCTDVARWASINILLALSYRYRPSHGLRPEKDNERAWLYFKNAASVLTELSLRRSDLLSIQTLLAIAIFIRGNCGLSPTVPIVTAAMRSCQALGLHKRSYRTDLGPIEQEQRKRAFWVAFFFDQACSMNVGMAALQDHEDYDVDLPSEDPAEESGGQDCGIRYFRLLCQLTVIKSRIYKELYSTKAFGRSISEVRAAVYRLNAKLEKWKRDNPYMDVSSSSSSSSPAGAAGKEDAELIAKIGQRLTYYNSLIVINRVPFLHEVVVWRTLRPDSDSPIDFKSAFAQSYESIEVCVQAARDSLKLIDLLPWRDVGYAWSLLDYIFVAVMIVFSSILRETKSPKTQEDLKLLNTAVTYFNTLAPQNGRSKTAKFMATISSIMERVAKKVVEKEAKMWDGSSTGSVAGKPFSTPADVHIPNIEGLPPVNSSGYVVPGSPSVQSFMRGATIPSSGINTSTENNMAGLRPEPLPQDIEQLSTAPSYPWLLPDAYGYSSLANDRSVPSELWQIPITAEWQMLDQFPEWQANAGMPQSMDQGMDASPVQDVPQYLFNQSTWHRYG